MGPIERAGAAGGLSKLLVESLVRCFVRGVKSCTDELFLGRWAQLGIRGGLIGGSLVLLFPLNCKTMGEAPRN
jgi:hypothetical protein